MFKIQDERKIVYTIKQLADCDSNTLLYKKVIAKCDTVSFDKSQQIEVLELQKVNLIETIASKDAIITIGDKTIKEKDKQIKILKIQKGIITTVLVAITTFAIYISIK